MIEDSGDTLKPKVSEGLSFSKKKCHFSIIVLITNFPFNTDGTLVF